MFGGFEAETGVGAGDDDGLVGEGRGGLRDFDEELAVEKAEEEGHEEKGAGAEWSSLIKTS